MRKKVAIHQPNFFPWLGFFEKMIQCDTFIILDTAQIPKSGSSYVNRVELLAKNKIWAASVGIKRLHGAVMPIKNVEIFEDIKKKKIIRSIYHSYQQASYFNSESPHISDLIMNKEANLCGYNMNGIYYAAEKLGIEQSKIVKSSELDFDMTKENLSELIVKMVIKVGGDTFLSGPQSAWHMDRNVFDAAGINIEFTEYRCPMYSQINASEFVPGLSFIDAVLNIGWDATRNLLSPKC